MKKLIIAIACILSSNNVFASDKISICDIEVEAEHLRDAAPGTSIAEKSKDFSFSGARVKVCSLGKATAVVATFSDGSLAGKSEAIIFNGRQ